MCLRPVSRIVTRGGGVLGLGGKLPYFSFRKAKLTLAVALPRPPFLLSPSLVVESGDVDNTCVVHRLWKRLSESTERDLVSARFVV